MRKSHANPELDKLLSQEELNEKSLKDDWALGLSKERAVFLDNQFWKVPEQYSIDDLLAEELE